MVVGQDGRIVQVLDNLLSNAASFNPKGAKIIFDLRIKASPAQAVLQILDEGPIPENRLETVFHRFYSERPKGRSFGDHSGLGLSIAKQIIEGHDGSLVASNRDTGGACFTDPAACLECGPVIPHQLNRRCFIKTVLFLSLNLDKLSACKLTMSP